MNIDGIQGKIELDVSQALKAVDTLEARLNKLGKSNGNDMSGIQRQIDKLANSLIASHRKLEKEMNSIYDSISKKQKSYIEQATKQEKLYTESIKQEAKKRQDALSKQAMQTTRKGQDKSEQALNDRILLEQKKFLARRLAEYKSFGLKVTKIMKGIIWAPIFINNAVFMFQGVFNTLGRLWDSTIGQVIKINSEIEDYITRLKVSTGTLMAARAVWEDVSKFATESVYGFNESVQAATTLLPILRGGRDELKQWLPIIGDIAAGFGLTYEEATTGFIRSYSSGIASSELFREKGVSTALGFIPGKKYSGRDTADQILKEWNSVTSIFRGASEELSKNWSGILNKISDQFFLLVRDIGEADLFKDMKFALQFALDKFEALRNSGQGYKQLVNTIAETLKKVFERTVNVFKALFQGIRNMWIIGDMITDALKTDESRAIDGRIEILEQRKNDLQTSMFTRAASETPDKVKVINDELVRLREIQKSIDEPFYELTKLLDSSVKEWDDVTGSIKDYKNELKGVGELPLDPHIQAAQGIKERKIDAMRKQALLDKQNDQIASATKEALDKVSSVIEKAKLDSIRFTQGEWSAFVAETQIEAKKLGEKISDAIAQAGADGTIEAAKAQGSFFKAMLDSKIAEYRQELNEMRRAAQSELKSLGMTSSEKERFNIESAFSDYKWINLPPQLQKQIDLTKSMQLASINAKEAIDKQSQSIQHQSSIVQAAIPEWNSYARQLQQIQVIYKSSSVGASSESLKEAALERDRSIQLLDATTISNYRQQIEDLNFEIGNINLTDSEIELREFNRELSRLVSPEFRTKFPELAREMEEVFRKKFDASQIVTFKQGWESALKDLRNSFMTQGQAIKTFMEDIFSGLSSALDDAFFRVMKGQFESLQEVFESFADSILRSISQIMSNQISSQMMSGLAGMFAGVFHSGGVVGSGSATQQLVNPLVFAGAPTYHSGGIVGLSPGDVPIIAQAGELILPRGSWGVGSAQSKPQQVQIINQSGQELKLSKAQTTSDIQGEILTLWIDGVQRNRLGIRNLLRGA